MTVAADRPATLTEAACWVINEPTPDGKISRTRTTVAAWRAGDLADIGDQRPPPRPARPSRPELKAPRDMPRRRKGGPAGRLAFVHAIAHIEFNAIDLAWDIIARFAATDLPGDFYDDWVGVAGDEAEHFNLLCRRLEALGGAYGDLPAHDGLWEAAANTSGDLMARLALVPMVLEARGLDTTPGAVRRLRDSGDTETADLLARIGGEEIPHVAAGVRWFEFLAARRNVDPIAKFHECVETHFAGRIKPPFNADARQAARMDAAYYMPYTSP